MKKILLLFSVILVMGNTKISSLSEGYIIKFKTEKKLVMLSQKHKGNIKILPSLKMAFVDTLEKSSFNKDDIEYIEPNYKYHIFSEPTDPSFLNQWGLEKIKAKEAWDIETGKDVVVGVIDTGVDYKHEDLKNNMWVNIAEQDGVKGVDDDENGYIDDIYGYDFVNKDADPMDDNRHGTHCAGVIGAEANDVGVVGINWNVKIMALKFLDRLGNGNTTDAILAIDYAIKKDVKILSNSWGGGPEGQALKDAITYAQENGVLFIAAAGNSYTSLPNYPASYEHDNIISVAASNNLDTRPAFSNYGIPHVDITAPGKSIYSTIPNNRYGYASGTSMAAPHVSGAVALLWASIQELSYLEVKERILNTSDYLSYWENLVASGGRLNLYNMLMDIRPERPIPPDEEKWNKVDFEIATEHPYKNKTSMAWTIALPVNTEYIRFHFKKFDTEKNYDEFTIKGVKTLKYSGKLGTHTTSHARTTNLTELEITFKSDFSNTRYGFDLDYYEIQ